MDYMPVNGVVDAARWSARSALPDAPVVNDARRERNFLRRPMSIAGELLRRWVNSRTRT